MPPDKGGIRSAENYLLLFSHFWFATPQEVLQADWQEVWHSPQPPVTALLVRSRVAIVLIRSIIYNLSSSKMFDAQNHPRTILSLCMITRAGRDVKIFVAETPFGTRRFIPPWADISANLLLPPLLCAETSWFSFSIFQRSAKDDSFSERPSLFKKSKKLSKNA